ncbi:MAG TPA: hypothetical protein VNH42_06060 [Mariprofundaceae bacterium]|nr:hypothetical protein [Mariprofundaceae bacterium]
MEFAALIVGVVISIYCGKEWQAKRYLYPVPGAYAVLQELVLMWSGQAEFSILFILTYAAVYYLFAFIAKKL